MAEREVNERWAAWLRRRMQRQGGLTPTTLARSSGVDQSVISRWLNEGRTPQIDLLRKIAGPLDVGLLDLLIAAGYIDRTEVTPVEPADTGPADFEEAVAHSPLIDEAKQHLLRQYDLLSRLSERGGSKEDIRATTPPAQRPLRAVARKRPPRTP